VSTIDELLTGDRTEADVLRPVLPEPTRTTQELVERASRLRDSTRLLSEDVAEVHDSALHLQLSARTDEAAKRSVIELLDELADLGIAWRDIARMVGVSVPALRKWRHGEPATGEHRRGVARLVAFVGVLNSDHLIQDVASWMEIPIGESHVTGIDLYAVGRASDLLLYAASRIGSDDLLDTFDPGWRTKIDHRFEIVAGGDGEPLVRMRPSE
jgi:hypothetical protein